MVVFELVLVKYSQQRNEEVFLSMKSALQVGSLKAAKQQREKNWEKRILRELETDKIRLKMVKSEKNRGGNKLSGGKKKEREKGEADSAPWTAPGV